MYDYMIINDYAHMWTWIKHFPLFSMVFNDFWREGSTDGDIMSSHVKELMVQNTENSYDCWVMDEELPDLIIDDS